MQTLTLSSSAFLKQYTAAIEHVKQTKQPIVLTRRNTPQAVIVCLEDYARLKELYDPLGNAPTEK